MTTHDLLSALFSWWPFVMFIAAWIVMARFTRQRTASGFTMIQLHDRQVAEIRRLNTTLEKIAAILDKPSQSSSPP